jgi:hypothetical protein
LRRRQDIGNLDPDAMTELAIALGPPGLAVEPEGFIECCMHRLGFPRFPGHIE